MPTRDAWVNITNMSYLDGYCQNEIRGWLLPLLDTWVVIANMRCLDGYYQHEIPGWL